MHSELETVSTFQSKNSTEDYYCLLLESITDYAIFLLDPTGRVVTWNAGAQQIEQYKPEEIIGKHYSVFYTEEAKAKNYPVQQLAVAKSEGKFEAEGWRVRKDGAVFWARVAITTIYNQEKIPVGYSKTIRNVSEQKKRKTIFVKHTKN